jgi:hypothetical protein
MGAEIYSTRAKRLKAGISRMAALRCPKGGEKQARLGYSLLIILYSPQLTLGARQLLDMIGYDSVVAA